MCRDVVSGFFESAYRGWESDMEYHSEMQKMNEKMLSKQELFGVNLVGNEKFCQWAHSYTEFEEPLMPEDLVDVKPPMCEWSKEMDMIFGDRA